VFIELDGNGPMYQQLTRAIKRSVVRGDLAYGSKLPNTRDFAIELGVSRNTLRAAFDQLMAEGLIEARVGSGTFVAYAGLAQVKKPSLRAVRAQSRFSARVRKIKNFAVASMHKGLRYNLQYGEPIHDLAAVDSWRRALSHAATHTKLEYPGAQGLPTLRQSLCDYLLRRRGIDTTPEHILIVTGTQQALSLTANVLVNEDDCVALEDPFYFGAHHAFTACGARLHFVPVNEDGIDCSVLREESAKLIFVTPAHQFPSGAVMSMSRRDELLSLAATKGGWIFEDDYDSEFRYDAKPIPALKAMDSQDRVIYAGSFSKVMFPSMRLGYMVLPDALIKDFVLAKRVMDFGNPSIEQAAMARFIANGDFDRHLRKVLRIVRERRKALLEDLNKVGRGQFEIRGTDAGMHLIAWMPRMTHTQCNALIALASTHGLGLHPVEPHFNKRPAIPGLLIGYAGLSTKEIVSATQLLDSCLSKLLDESISTKKSGRSD
jgi:GntR family transcriptional regulator / MocR family aminotransferase